MSLRKLAIITTHPIQYNAPWFQLLSQRGNIQLKVFYTWSQVEKGEKYDPGFGRNVDWDVPLLEGYDYTFIENISKHPGSATFKGIENPTLTREIELWQPDVVLVFGWKLKGHYSVLKYFKGKIPVLFRGDSILKYNLPWWKKVARNRVLKYVFKYIDKALYVGTENKKYFLSAGLREDQLVFAPHAVDNQRFAQSLPGSINGWPRDPKDKLVFLFAGKLEPVKNPRLLLEAFKKITNGVELVIAGSGILESELKKEYGYLKHVSFLGFQNQRDIPGVYKQADVFVLCSHSETWGLSVNEAMACSKPVLVSDRCGCAADLIDDGKNGYIFRAGDKRDLKEKIQLLIDRKAELPKMGAHSFEKIQDWSFDAIAETVEKEVMQVQDKR